MDNFLIGYLFAKWSIRKHIKQALVEILWPDAVAIDFSFVFVVGSAL